MPEPIITLTTDFGTGSPYVAAMKGVILGINAAARIIDLSHAIPPQDLHYTAYFLRTVLPTFPPGPVHVIVVDPGVGTDRALLYVEMAGQHLLVPDNGCWTGLASPAFLHLRRLTEPRFWRHPVSATFHGRDILAPVAAHLSLGLDPAALGPVTSEFVKLESIQPTRDPVSGAILGQVQFVDPFGNLITNVPAQAVRELTPTAPAGDAVRRTAMRVCVGTTEVARQVRSYAEAEPGQLVFLFSSEDFLEVAVAQGNAARQLGARVGTPVTITMNAEP